MKQKKEQLKFTFADFCAGIGGFHVAMSQLGGTCVYASEIEVNAVNTYHENFGIDASHDITDLSNLETMPDFDVLCAGFPCQPFSKGSTARRGFADTRGTIFFFIQEILAKKQPRYFILENVRSLVTHDGGNTWRVIKECLKEVGYGITEVPIIMSPVQFGIPQLRGRVVIMGVLGEGPLDITNELPQDICKMNALYDSVPIEKSVGMEYHITPYEEKVLEAWNEFYQGIDETTIGYPIWAELFLEQKNGRKAPLKTPRFLRGERARFPAWKKEFIRKNLELYRRNQVFIDGWLEKNNNLEKFRSTDRKFEWQAADSIDSLWDGIIQFRPSGIRVSAPRVFPALVAMVHIPIIGKYRRRITPREAARLQSFPDSFICNPDDHIAYRQFGNAVNVQAISYFASKLFERYPMKRENSHER